MGRGSTKSIQGLLALVFSNSRGRGARSTATLAFGAVALAACVAATPAAGSIVFGSAQPLTLTWSQLRQGTSIEVCNAGPTPVPRLTPIPVDFAFTREGEPVPPTKVLTIAPPRHRLRAGRCASLHAGLTSETPVDAGEYTGSLLLVATGHGGSARLAVTVTTSAKKAAAPVGVAQPVAISIHNPTPFSRNAAAVLLLKEPSSTEEPLAIGQGCRASSDETDCPTLGNLYQGTHVARVSVIGPSTFNQGMGVQELPIEVHGFQHLVGTYEGTISLPGSTQPIALKLDAKDGWWCAVIALLIGVAVALATQLWNGRFQPHGELVERADKLTALYKPTPGSQAPHVELDTPKLEEYVAGVKAAIERYAASVVMFDATSEAYKAIESSLKLAADDAAIFTGPGGLAPLLRQLDGETSSATRMLQFVQVTDVPAILKAASAILKGEKLGVGGATRRAEEAEALMPAIAGWHTLADEFLMHVVWLKLLTAKVPKAKLSQLYYVAVKMSSLRQRLFDVSNAGELAELRASPQLWATLERIAFLGRTYDTPRPLGSALPKDSKGNLDLPLIGKLELEAIGYRSSKGPPFTIEEVLAHPADVVIEPAKPARLPQRKVARLTGDVIALAVTAAVSIVAGLSTFYFAKPFGSFIDYLTVIVIGSASQTVLKAILNQTAILLHDFSPLTPTIAARTLASAHAEGAGH